MFRIPKKTSGKKSKKQKEDKKEVTIDETNEIIRDVADLRKLTTIERKKSEAYEFLSEKLLSDSDLEQKTEISNPALWSGLDMYIDFYERLGLPLIAQMLRDLKESLMKHFISHKRLGRKELVEMVKALGLPIDTDVLEGIKKRRDVF